MVVSKIISLSIFWCKTLYNGSLLLSLILLLHTNDIPCQVIISLEEEEDSLELDSIEGDSIVGDSTADITHILGLEFLNSL